jgi:hypothetical protein
MTEPQLPPYVNLQGLPLPELRFDKAKREITGAQIISSKKGKERIIHIQFFSSTPGKQNDSYEIVATETHMKSISRLLSENMPHSVIHSVTPYLTVTETPDGSLLVMLTENGKRLMEDRVQVDDLVVSVQGTEIRLTDKREHPSLYPPFVLSGGEMWYHKHSQKRNHAFRDDILRDGWVKMTKHIR